MIIQRGSILTVNIDQIGSSVSGSDVVVHVVGIEYPDEFAGRAAELIAKARVNVRPRQGTRDKVNTDLTSINRVLDQITKSFNELVGQVSDLQEIVKTKTYSATITSTLSVTSDVVPWAVVAVDPAYSWIPFFAYASAKTAPVGADMVLDIQVASTFAAADSPDWVSIFPSGGSKLVILDGTNVGGPTTEFA